MTRPIGVNRVTRRYLAAIDRATGLATPWNPNDSGRVLLHTPSPVSALAVEGGYVYFASATTGEVLRADLRRPPRSIRTGACVVRRSGGSARQRHDDGRQPAASLYLGGDFDAISGTSIRADGAARAGGGGHRRRAAHAGRRPSTAPTAPRSSARCCRSARTIYLGGDFTSVNVAVPPRLRRRRRRHRRDRPARAATCSARPASTAWRPTARRCSSPASRSAPRWWARPAFRARCSRRTARPAAWCRRARPSSPAGSTPDWSTTSRPARQRRATTPWDRVVADDSGLVHLLAGHGLLDYYPALPGNPPGAPTLTAAVDRQHRGAVVDAGRRGGTPIELHRLRRLGDRARTTWRRSWCAARPTLHGDRAQRPVLRDRRRPERLRRGAAVQRSAGAGRSAAVHAAAHGTRTADPHHRRVRRHA